MANNLIVGYTHAGREPRRRRGELFPFVDILEGRVGVHVVRLRAVHAEQRAPLQHLPAAGQLHQVRHKHTMELRPGPPSGTNPRTSSSQGEQSVYVYNSLDGFLRRRERLPRESESHDFAGESATVSRSDRTTFPGMEKPIQPLEVFYTGAYVQDDWRVRGQLEIEPRASASTCRSSAKPDSPTQRRRLTFRDEDRQPRAVPRAASCRTPTSCGRRVWDSTGTSRGDRHDAGARRHRHLHRQPAYVWISNQVGNTGVL